MWLLEVKNKRQIMYLFIKNNETPPNELIDSKYFIDASDECVKDMILNNKFYLGINYINFFVGSNNSGKSRFLRGLLKFNKSIDNYQILTEKTNIENNFDVFKSVDWINSYRRSRDSGFINRDRNYNDIVETFFSNAYNKEINVFDLIKNKNKFNDIFNIIDSIQEDINNSVYSSRIELNGFKKVVDVIIKLKNDISFFENNQISDKIYIPILRSSIKSEFYDNEIFYKTIKKLYSLNDENIYTGLNLYEDVLKVRNSLKEKRKGFEEFEKFLSKNFFNDQLIEIIADLEQKQLMLFVNGDERKIHDIGDGIQQIILLLFPIYTAVENSWIFIEEPETHLHPGLQRVLIQTLLNDDYILSKNLKFFFTTHSNHFLDVSISSDSIFIYQFEKESSENFKVKNVKPNKQILNLLGVNNSSVFLANSSIWVEGPTDRKYISKFLKLYCENEKVQNLKEDIDFAFFEYGGSLIDHYLFDADFDELFSEDEVREKINSFALSNKIYLLADNDNAKGKKLTRRKKLEDLSKGESFMYQNTNYREIENLLPVNIIKEFLKELVYTKDIEKIENIKFSRNDYVKVGLGEFIKDLFLKNGISKHKSFKAENDTLKSSYKTKLCDLVINSEISYSDLIEDNKMLDGIVNNLYNFIMPNN